jgi:hypothetical protein
MVNGNIAVASQAPIVIRERLRENPFCQSVIMLNMC